MALYMETTKISSTKTAAEIQEYLAASGARQILTKYDADRHNPLSFILHLEASLCRSRYPSESTRSSSTSRRKRHRGIEPRPRLPTSGEPSVWPGVRSSGGSNLSSR